VNEQIELLFRMVSGVGRGTDVLDGGPSTSGEEPVSGVVCPHWPFVSMKYVVTEMHLTCA